MKYIEQNIIDKLLERKSQVKDQQLFNRYIKRYIKFISDCLNKDFSNDDKVNVHHILPKSWDEHHQYVKDYANLIILPFRYHVVAHQLLARTTDKPMQFALLKIVNLVKQYNHFDVHISSRLLDQAYKNVCSPVVNLSTGKVYRSVAEANRECQSTLISAACTKCFKVDGDYWAFLEEVEQVGSYQQVNQNRIERNRQLRDKALDVCRKPVINLNTGDVYRCSREADEKLGYPIGSVNCSCFTGYKYQGNYWALLSDVEQTSVEYQLEIRKSKVWRPVINLTTMIQYEGMSEAARQLKDQFPSITGPLIRNACLTGTKLYKQHWAFLDEYQQYGRETLLEKFNQLHPPKKGAIHLSKQIIDLATGQVFKSSHDCDRAHNQFRGWTRRQYNKETKDHFFVLMKDYEQDKQHFDQREQQRRQKYLLKEQQNQQRLQTPVRSGRKIINTIDGTIYESGTECSRAFGKCDGWAQSVIANNRHTDQYHFMYYDEYLKQNS